MRTNMKAVYIMFIMIIYLNINQNRAHKNEEIEISAPYVRPILQCPTDDDISSMETSWSEECNGGGDCKGKLCCSNKCVDGIIPDPLCPSVRRYAQHTFRGLLGAYVPQCTEDGLFKQIQFYEGYLWCVNVHTGKAVTPLVRGKLPEC